MISLFSRELIIIGDKAFPVNTLSVQEIKSFFLNKKSFIENQKVLVINYEYNNNLRNCFEKIILNKNKKSLEKYWRKAYYKGLKPPKIVKSTTMLYAYFKEVTPSIGYINAKDIKEKNMKILYRSECP